ncbi:alpha/beta-hydrolase N-terminal domain-containing protein [Ornithinimicrobium sp. LYQ121]|uniref:alpha/beta-hydrolase N-terminal domain-containing protein n=1 Tax=Ornithinimicrobium sp. LYQ121 TaxID=3378801 RepID=UPI003854DB9F
MWSSVLPSLIPRPRLMQKGSAAGGYAQMVLAGVFLGIAYGLGASAGWLFRSLGLPVPSAQVRAAARKVLAVVAPVGLLVAGRPGRTWQVDQRLGIGRDAGMPGPGARPLSWGWFSRWCSWRPDVDRRGTDRREPPAPRTGLRTPLRRDRCRRLVRDARSTKPAAQELEQIQGRGPRSRSPLNSGRLRARDSAQRCSRKASTAQSVASARPGCTPSATSSV